MSVMLLWVFLRNSIRSSHAKERNNGTFFVDSIMHKCVSSTLYLTPFQNKKIPHHIFIHSLSCDPLIILWRSQYVLSYSWYDVVPHALHMSSVSSWHCTVTCLCNYWLVLDIVTQGWWFFRLQRFPIKWLVFLSFCQNKVTTLYLWSL